MRTRALARISLAFLLLAAGVARSRAAVEPALTNSAVVDLCKAGLGDDLVIAKIKQAPNVDFQLDTDSLLALRKQGVSSEVVKAMLEKTTARPVVNLPPAPFAAGIPGRSGGAVLSTKDGEFPLTLRMGDLTTTGFAFVQMRYLNVSGIHSPTRTNDHGCSILVNSDIDPATSDQFQVVILDTDDDDKIRSMRLGRGSAFREGMRDFLAVDSDYVVHYTTQPAGTNTFRIIPSSPLAPGEYGVLTGGMSLYDFGVD